MPTAGMNERPNTPAIDSEPPIALDKFIEQSGLSAVTVWRYRRAGWLNTLNICGRHYLTRAEIARFNARAAAGEFAREPGRPKRRNPHDLSDLTKSLADNFGSASNTETAKSIASVC